MGTNEDVGREEKITATLVGDGRFAWHLVISSKERAGSSAETEENTEESSADAW